MQSFGWKSGHLAGWCPVRLTVPKAWSQYFERVACAENILAVTTVKKHEYEGVNGGICVYQNITENNDGTERDLIDFSRSEIIPDPHYMDRKHAQSKNDHNDNKNLHNSHISLSSCLCKWFLNRGFIVALDHFSHPLNVSPKLMTYFDVVRRDHEQRQYIKRYKNNQGEHFWVIGFRPLFVTLCFPWGIFLCPENRDVWSNETDTRDP